MSDSMNEKSELPTPESMGMVEVSRDDFMTWLMKTTIDIHSSAHSSGQGYYTMWKDPRNDIIIGRSYDGFLGKPLLYMVIPRISKLIAKAVRQ